ncbi:hypothetical protein ABKV19_024287 [Rosa sericea]
MKHNDDHRNKVFTSPKLMAKETSVANSSCRVYYGAAAGAVPFMWESQPGTPKHTLSKTSLPPLTPPPSYSFNTTPKHSSSSMQRSGSRAKALLDSIFPRVLKWRKAARNMSPSSSVSWSSSSSSSCSSTSSKGTQKRYSVSRVPFGYDDEDEDEDLTRSGSPTSTLCFGIERRGSDYFRGCNSVRKIKFASMSIASRDQSRRGRTAEN